MKSDTTTAAAETRESPTAALKRLLAEAEAIKNAPPLPENTPDPFTEKHISPVIVLLALRVDELCGIVKAQRLEIAETKLAVMQTLLELKRHIENGDHHGSTAAITKLVDALAGIKDEARRQADATEKLAGTAEEARETNTDGFEVQAMATLHTTGKLPETLKPRLAKGIGMNPGETL